MLHCPSAADLWVLQTHPVRGPTALRRGLRDLSAQAAPPFPGLHVVPCLREARLLLVVELQNLSGKCGFRWGGVAAGGEGSQAQSGNQTPSVAHPLQLPRPP